MTEKLGWRDALEPTGKKYRNFLNGAARRVHNSGGSSWPGAASVTHPANTREPSRDYNSVLGIPLTIVVPSEASSVEIIQITAVPKNGTVVLSDGRTLVTVGQRLTPAQAVGLRFKPNGLASSSRLAFQVVVPGHPPTNWVVGLPFDPAAGTIIPLAPVEPPAGTHPTEAARKPATKASSTARSTIASSVDATRLSSPSATVCAANAVGFASAAVPPAAPKAEPPAGTDVTAAAVKPATTASPTGTSTEASSADITTLSRPSATVSAATMPFASATAAAPKADPPADYNSVYGQALNIAVPTEEASFETIQITALPTNGTIVLADGTTRVVAGESLTPAQAAGLRFKANGVAASSRLDFSIALPRLPVRHGSVPLPFDVQKHTVILPTTAAIPRPTSSLASSATTSAASAPTGTASADLTAPVNPNPIVLENEKAGTPQSVWQIAPGGDSTKIQGFTTSISTPLGGTVQFKINNQTGNGSYSIQIYRLGYYGGNGATLVKTLTHSGSAVVQPNPLKDGTTGLVDAGNWSVTDSWTVPSSATSGVYVANVIDGSQVFQIPFVVTNPISTSDIVFQTSDETWQAYNGFGGVNLYGGNGPANPPAPNFGQGAAFAVSYNRPIVTRDSIGSAAGPQDFLFGAEYSAIYWLEQNGYDVSYISGIDTATNGSLLLNHKVFMDAGHDEYWTGSQVANVQAAANQGVNLAFFSGNEIFWQTRLSPSIDSSAAANRTLVTYKDTHFNTEIDPSGKATGTFEDPRLGSPAMPSNALTGTLFQVDGLSTTINSPITIPYGNTLLRFWRNTSVAATAPNQTASLESSLLGYEWDSSPDNTFMPAGLINLSSTTVQDPTAYNTNWGNVDTAGTATNSLVEYRNPTSGALVFGAGTVFWSWGLSNQHDNSPSPFSSDTSDPNVQQAVLNLLADMGVQPQTLQASLVIASQSTDHTPPTSVISSISTTNVEEGRTVTVSGAATDSGGGVIAGVQISTDSGQTWHPASGQVGSAGMNWTYSFAAPAPGAYTIRSRAIDDSVNVEAPGTGVSYKVAPSTALSLFASSAAPDIASDSAAIEVGLKFTTATSGVITGIRFYKGSGNTGTHVGDLWNSSGTLLATATFTNETASGWQQVNFASPVNITPGTTYIASYHTNTGHYAETPYFFATYQGQSAGSLNAPGGSLNGVYAYGASSTFPNSTSVDTADNYWVDVVFNDSGRSPPVLNNVAVSASYAAGGTATTLSSGTSVSDPQSTTLSSGSVSITSGLASDASDLLTASTTGTSITATYNASTGVLNLTGTDTLVHYQQVLDSVSYSSSNQDPTNYGADPSRTISWLVNDGTVSSPAQTTTINITGGPVTDNLFSRSATPGTITENDPSAVNLGVKFQASTSGTIIGIRFYKGPQNTGTHVGDLWSSSGTLLASATFTNETASGWQQVNFASPVSITAGTMYIASYEAPNGEYSADQNFFTSATNNGPLTAPSSASSGGNGVYTYGSSNPFPNNTFNASNYWVDVVFTPSAPLTFTSQASISGTAQEGSVLTAAGTTNDASAVISYQWQSSSDGTNWTNIAGATRQTYTPVETDETHLLRVIETATDSTTSQSATSTSPATAAVTDISLAFTTQAAISGSAVVGSTLTAVSGTLNDADAALGGYQWQSSSDGINWTNIAGATASTYTPVAADQGRQLQVIETAADADGGPTKTSTSPATSAVTNNTLTFNPQASISGTAQEGSLLTAAGATSDSNAVISYQWQSSIDGGTTWVNIAGATASTYTPLEADETHLLHVVETATDAATSQGGTSTSGATAAVTDITLIFTTAAAITGSAAVGSTLTAVKGTLNDADAVVTGYQWQSSSDGINWTNIVGATASTYTPVAADQGRQLQVIETATDADGGPTKTSTSPATAPVSPGPSSLFAANITPTNVTEDDPSAVNLGVKFQASTSGTIIGIRFYKGPQNTGTHVGDLWSSSGTLLASATFTNETASGWQQVNFASPVSITAGTMYIASYEAPNGEYSADQNFFTSATNNGPLTAPSSASSGGNGVYTYGSSNPFPNNTFNASNYWVDVVFTPSAPLTFTSQASISGTAQEGSVLTAAGTTNDASAVISYQWQSSSDGTNWTNIAGATRQTYTPVETDETHLLRVIETATDSTTSQSATSTSPATAAVTDISLAFTTQAAISGSAVVGSTLTAVSGTLNDADAALGGYQWQSSSDGINWTNIAGATASTYTPVAADQGRQLQVIETAADADGGPTKTSTSPATSAVTNNTLTFNPQASISGTAQEGSLLTAAGATSDSNAVISYQWQSSIDGGTTWVNIAGATASTYTPLEADETHLLHVVETATDAATSQGGTSTSGATAAVTDITLIFTTAAAITGSAAVGSTLTAVKGTLNDADAVVTGYQWQSSSDGINWTNIVGATASTYTPVAADQGRQLQVIETATDADGGPTKTSTSPATAPVSPGPTGFTFASATSNLQALQGGNASLAANTPIGTFTQTGGVAGHSFSYTLSGSGSSLFVLSSSQGMLSTGSSAVPGGTTAALSIQVSDLTTGAKSALLPFEIVAGKSAAETINVSTLNIAASTPTFLYGLGGKDTLNALGMTGPMWFVGGAGADTITGGTGPNTYLYAAAGNSTPSAFDVITNFNSGSDRIDLTGLGSTKLSFVSNQVSTTIPARSIGWQQSGGNTFVYVNTTAATEALGSANMEIELNGTIPIVASNLLHS